VSEDQHAGRVHLLGSPALGIVGAGPGGALGLVSIAVLGQGYWPLPWYLRGTTLVGYYDAPPVDLEDCPVVIAMPEMASEASRRLSGSHEIFYNGLRSEVPLAVFVRRDVRAEEVRLP
jgi:hypothetical protein